MIRRFFKPNLTNTINNIYSRLNCKGCNKIVYDQTKNATNLKDKRTNNNANPAKNKYPTTIDFLTQFIIVGLLLWL